MLPPKFTYFPKGPIEGFNVGDHVQYLDQEGNCIQGVIISFVGSEGAQVRSPRQRNPVIVLIKNLRLRPQ